jgi:hypothetical protein
MKNFIIGLAILTSGSAFADWRDGRHAEYKQLIEKKLFEVVGINSKDVLRLKFIKLDGKIKSGRELFGITNVCFNYSYYGETIRLENNKCMEISGLDKKMASVGKTIEYRMADIAADISTFAIDNNIPITENDNIKNIYFKVSALSDDESKSRIISFEKYKNKSRLFNTPYVEAFGLNEDNREAPSVALGSVEINKGGLSNPPVDTIYELENTSSTVYTKILNLSKDDNSKTGKNLEACGILCLPGLIVASPYLIYKGIKDHNSGKETSDIVKLLDEARLGSGSHLKVFVKEVIEDNSSLTPSEVVSLLRQGDKNLSFIEADWKNFRLGNQMGVMTSVNTLEEIKEKIITRSLDTRKISN